MSCPVCNSSRLDIKNNSYFCTNCNIYIGQVGHEDELENQRRASSDSAVSSGSKQASGKEFFYKVHEPYEIRFPFLHGLVKWTIKIASIFLLLFFFTKDFYYIDFQNKCYIGIGPSWIEFSNGTIKKAIGTLKTASPKDYEKLCQRVSFVNPNISCGGMEGGCFHPERPRTIDISSSHNSFMFSHVVIVHETCHAVQYFEKRPFSEDECYSEGERLLKELVTY